MCKEHFPKAVHVETWPGPLLPVPAPDVSSVAEVEEREEEWETPYHTEQPDRPCTKLKHCTILKHCNKLNTLPDNEPNYTKHCNKLNFVPK